MRLRGEPRSVSVAAEAQEDAILAGQEAAEALPRLVEAPAAGAEPQGLYLAVGKRCFDIAIVVLLLPLWALVYATIVAVLLVFEGRPIHHSSVRIGRDGKEIRILKFRTMHLNADSALSGLLAGDPELEREFRDSVKLRYDPRVTKVGRLLRSSSLDELPQLVTILRGHMSLVGPRPLLPSELDGLYASGAEEILMFQPGLTGLWQISGRSLLPYEQRFVLGLRYSQMCSLKTDIAILAKTVPSVMAARGAY
jgi:lipopolysaccharide/colanic/teichoic acid biosynthesis glycosyltransferase